MACHFPSKLQYLRFPHLLRRAKKGHLLFVDALRGLGCLWVILHHTFSSFPLQSGVAFWPLDLLVHVSRIGWLGVSLFLELSGFCLFYPLVKRRTDPQQNPFASLQNPSAYNIDIRAFFVKRARRLLPPYYAAIILSSLILLLEQHLGLTQRLGWHRVFDTRQDLLLHLTMLHNLTAATFASITPVFWSLALEWDLYLIFPLLVFLVFRFGLRAILAPAFVVAVLWQGWAYHRFGFSWNYDSLVASTYHALPGRAFEFVCGMTAAYFVARPQPGQYKIAAVLLGVLLVPGLWYVLKISRFGPLLDQTWGIIFASLLILLSRWNDEALIRNRVSSALVWTGTISYSLYLIHFKLIELTTPAVMHLPNSEGVAVCLGFARIPILVGLAYLFHLAFERPFMGSSTRAAPKTVRQAETAAAESPAP